MSDRATCWSVVINNPVASDEENVAAARQKGWKVVGQKETGESGTPHYQLMVSTPQVRFSAVKKAFPRANIQVARNKAALEQYVIKEETRTGDLPETESKFPTLAGFYKLLVPKLFNLNKTLRVSTQGGWYDTANGLDHEQRLLDALDAGTSELIREGYHVETLVVNPQTRSAWKRFGMDIVERTIQELSKMSIDRQTDRQTELTSRLDDITNGPTSGSIRRKVLRKDESDSSSESEEDEGSTCSEESVSGSEGTSQDFD